HERHAQVATVDSRGRRRARRRVGVLAPRASSVPAEGALQPVEEPDGERLGLMKAPAVEVIGHRTRPERRRTASADAEREDHGDETADTPTGALTAPELADHFHG